MSQLYASLLGFLVKSSMSSYVWIGMHVCAKSLGVAPRLSNARPLGSTKLANTPPPGKTRPVARGGGGHFRNFWVGMCRWNPGTLDLYQS